MKQQVSYPLADDMDLELHPARIARGKKVTYEATLSSIAGWLRWCILKGQGVPRLARRVAALDSGRLWDAR